MPNRSGQEKTLMGQTTALRRPRKGLGPSACVGEIWDSKTTLPRCKPMALTTAPMLCLFPIKGAALYVLSRRPRHGIPMNTWGSHRQTQKTNATARLANDSVRHLQRGEADEVSCTCSR